MNDQSAAAMQDLLHAGRVLTEMYSEAIPRVGNDSATALKEMAEEHEHHARILDEALDELDIGIAEAGEDTVTLMDEHLRLIRSAMDESSILETLALAERANSLLYGIAERSELPEEVDDVIAEQHAAERLHASVLSDRVPRTAGVMDAHPVACVTGGMTDDRNPDDFE